MHYHSLIGLNLSLPLKLSLCNDLDVNVQSTPAIILSSSNLFLQCSELSSFSHRVSICWGKSLTVPLHCKWKLEVYISKNIMELQGYLAWFLWNILMSLNSAVFSRLIIVYGNCKSTTILIDVQVPSKGFQGQKNCPSLYICKKTQIAVKSWLLKKKTTCNINPFVIKWKVCILFNCLCNLNKCTLFKYASDLVVCVKL